MKKYLVLGCGTSVDKRLSLHNPDGGSPEKDWEGEVTTVDHCKEVNPDILADLNILPYDWAGDDEYDEIHAYGVLEHQGSQGDGEFFFGQFNELHRTLKKGGLFLFRVPMWNHPCATGVPDHKRVMPLCLFTFLQESYYDNLGRHGFGDYRHLIKGYWDIVCAHEGDELLTVALRKA